MRRAGDLSSPALRGSLFCGVPIARIISGGQTGVDRAALDVALVLGIACGGWCPRGRLAEDGVIAARYPLYEAPSGDYAVRTEWNVRDADGTIALTKGEPEGGTRLTVEIARRHRKPCLQVDLRNPPDPRVVARWARAHHIRTLNVAGPRASSVPTAYDDATGFLVKLFEILRR